jgi:parallel beta-helix repeat protein
LAGNFEAGLRLNLGASDNLIEANASVSNTWYGFFLFKGLDVPEPGDDGRPKRNRFVSNVIRSNGKEAISLADSDDNLFATNQLYANGDKLRFERGLRNRLDGNDIPADVTVRTEGNPSPAASTFITPRSSLIIQVDTNSAVIFEDPHGRIFDPDEKGVATSLTPDGSRLILTAAEIGTTSKVEARSFWVRPTQGTVRVNPTGWTNGYGSGKQWVVQAEAPGQNLTYTVEDLAPNSAYSVHKAAFRLMSVNSDSSGKINFADITDGTNDVLYAIEPDLQVAIARQASGLVVSWTGGRLQSATGMALSTWREVSVPPGPFQTNIQPSGTMGFFRAVAP